MLLQADGEERSLELGFGFLWDIKAFVIMSDLGCSKSTASRVSKYCLVQKIDLFGHSRPASFKLPYPLTVVSSFLFLFICIALDDNIIIWTYAVV